MDRPLAPAPAPPPDNTPANAPVLRAVLLGCGTVNGGVLARAEASGPALGLRVVAVLTQSPRPERSDDARWTTDLEAALTTPADIVIEAMPDTPDAERGVEQALERGLAVVSANKMVLARRPDFEDLARSHGAPLRYSAAVGGGVPILETIAHMRAQGDQITAVRGVLNGTSNYVLDQLHAGRPFADAIAEAQAAGFAEADPSADLDGWDAAAKASLIARAALDAPIPLDAIKRQSITPSTTHVIGQAKTTGSIVRQCAVIDEGSASQARIDLQALAPDDHLASAHNEENAVEIHVADGRIERLHGKGAGREPTADAIFADVAAIRAEWRPV